MFPNYLRKGLCLLAMIPAFAATSFAADDVRPESVYERVMRTGELNCIYVVWPPFIIKDPNTGTLGGLSYDYTEALGKALNSKINWKQEGDIATYVEAVRTKRVDAECAAGFPTPERAKFVDFTEPYAFVPEYVYVRAGDTRFAKDPALLNKKETVFAGIEGDTSYQNAARAFPGATVNALAAMTPYSDLIMTLVTGKADAIATDVVTALDYNKNNKDKIEKVEMPYPVNLGLVSMTIPKGEYDLKSLINTTNSILIGNGTVEKILRKYDPQIEMLYSPAKPYNDGK